MNIIQGHSSALRRQHEHESASQGAEEAEACVAAP